MNVLEQSPASYKYSIILHGRIFGFLSNDCTGMSGLGTLLVSFVGDSAAFCYSSGEHKLRGAVKFKGHSNLHI